MHLSKSTSLFDHLVGAVEKRRRDLDPELLCRFEIDNQLELGGLHNRQVRGLFALQDAVNIDTCLPPCVRQVGTIADEATGNRVYAPVADRGDSVRESLRDMQASAVNPNRGSVLARYARTFNRLIVAKASSNSLSLMALTT
jgi:hypothetical protein